VTTNEKAQSIQTLMMSRRDYDEKLAEIEYDLVDLQETTKSNLSECDEKLEQLRPKVENVRVMKESLKQAGQPWQAERQLKVATKYQQLLQQIRELNYRHAEVRELKAQLSFWGLILCYFF